MNKNYRINLKNKKVLMISSRLGYNSLLYWDNILSEIKSHSADLRVFTSFPELETMNKKVKTEKMINGFKYYFKLPFSSYPYLILFPLPLFLIKIKKYKPDLIILNEFSFSVFYTIFFSFIFGNPKTLLLVESDPFRGHKNQHSIFRNLIRKYIVKKCDRILTNNRLGFDYLIEILKTNEEKIDISPYLVSQPPIIDKSLNIVINENKINFLFVGQIIKRKGLDFVLHAISNLNISDKNKMEFNIIGKGDHLESLKKIVADNNLENVKFLGFVDYNIISKYYEKSDCFILNTLNDYRALVGFEAIASGCSIIGSKFDGARYETIHENKNGYIVDPRNINEIKLAISSIISNSTLRSDFKIYSKKLSANFTIKKGLSNILNAMESTINN